MKYCRRSLWEPLSDDRAVEKIIIYPSIHFSQNSLHPLSDPVILLMTAHFELFRVELVSRSDGLSRLMQKVLDDRNVQD